MKTYFMAAIAAVLLLSLIACQKQPEKLQDTVPTDTATGDATVDSVGNQLTAADSDSEDLDPNSIGDIDSGLADVENI